MVILEDQRLRTNVSAGPTLPEQLCIDTNAPTCRCTQRFLFDCNEVTNLGMTHMYAVPHGLRLPHVQ